ncbi:hypothetical protein PASE110613_14345 [Paenibacillus sediminis]|uniref:Uncharacterized protein n=1 Tax=Paenibacillus sediminis TaxID=664909 RepID=A0ABS4H7K0_9BACL|nr:hypothetical protein [Paenibacillus sediminis]
MEAGEYSGGISFDFASIQFLSPIFTPSLSLPFRTLIIIRFRSQLNQFSSSFKPAKPHMGGQQLLS